MTRTDLCSQLIQQPYPIAMNNLSTLSETLTQLKKEGYTEDFNLRSSCAEYSDANIRLFPGEFIVDKHFRFEGPTDPADEAVVYAISSALFNLKGTLVNGYGPTSDPATDEVLQALRPEPAA